MINLFPAALEFAIILVLISGFLHALWNVCAKKSLNKASFLFSVQVFSFILLAPFCLLDLLNSTFSTEEYLLFAASMVAHGLYFILLAELYTIGDLSQVYPIIRGSSLLIVPLFGVVILHEQLSLLGWCSVFIIIGGIFFISEIKFFRLNYPVLILSLLVGFSIATYILVDRVALFHTDPVSLNQIGTLGNIIALLPLVLKEKSKNLKRELLLNFKMILLGTILAPLSYMLFLWATSMAPISTLAPMREFGTVVGSLLGVFFLKEANGKNRIIASAVITCGMVLLALSHY